MLLRTPISTLFPYTTLFRSESKEFGSLVTELTYKSFSVLLTGDSQVLGMEEALGVLPAGVDVLQVPHHGSKTGLSAEDRKSTRLNSSHANISYAVFCLKKKN